MTSTPIVSDNPARKRFEIDLGDGHFAVATYTMIPGIIRFDHTIVPERYGGRGLGTALVEASLAAARERHLKVIPICPFFRAYLKKHPDQQDLVDPGHLHLIES